MQSSGSESASPINHRVQFVSSTDTRGKHRIQAELKRLELEARFLEEELEQLEKTGKASTSCKEYQIVSLVYDGDIPSPTVSRMGSSMRLFKMLTTVEKRPDPLLPATIGPINPLWDRWFEGPQDSKGCRCWIL